MINLLSSSTFSFASNDVRQNEDYILSPIRASDGYLLAVADGVGAYAGADLVSKGAIDTLSKFSSYNWEGDRLVLDVFESVRLNVVRVNESNPAFKKAATTLSFCHVSQSGIRVGHIGDSRIYIRVGMHLKQLTTDHTQYQRLIDKGVYTSSELRSFGAGNKLYSALSRDLPLDYQEKWIRTSEVVDENGIFEIYLMSDGAYRIWEFRPRFSLPTLSEPSRFSSSLQRRIHRVGPVDDYSLVCAKFKVSSV